MKSIWKYSFEVIDTFALRMPIGAVVLTVQLQGKQPCLWALVDIDAPFELRQFRVFGTGFNLPADIENDRYIGTIQQMGGQLVWHVFEVTEATP